MRPNPLIARSLKAALSDFMGAPATGGHHTNEHVVLSVIGTKGSRGKDCSTFDAVREKYELPKACTFAQAFNACWHGSRDWRDFDLDVLKSSHEEFRHFGLPDRVEAALAHEAIAEHAKHAAGDVAEQQSEDNSNAPPLELLHRAGPVTRRRTARGAKKRKRGCAGSRNACSHSKFARRYQEAKRAYHKAGEQLRWAGIRGELL